MFRRKRRRTGMWLPPSLTQKITGNVAVSPSTIIAPTDGAIGNYDQVLVLRSPNTQGYYDAFDIPLVGDLKQNTLPGAAAGDTLADFAFGYSLKRIVGNIFVGVEQFRFTEEVDFPYLFMCTAGIMVKRVNDNGDAVNITIPDIYDSQTDPWIWRKSWLLCNQPQASHSVAAAYTAFPSNNAAYGSVAEGTKCDAKTRRTIKAEERLFMTLQTTALQALDGQAQQMVVNWYWNLRFFGRVFQSAGNRRNASR